MGTLYVVATPIGNLEDISPRAIRVLGEVSLIAAEDTRHTGSMLRRLGISTPMLSNHGFNERARVERFLEALSEGDVALVSDSGTPAISDPGAILVQAAAEAGISVMPIPGPSAVVAAVSASGLVDGPFLFLGFLPRPVGARRAALSKALESNVAIVLYESGNRIESLAELVSDLAPDRPVVVFRELTKLHEEAIRADAHDLPAKLSRATLKGEFAIVIGPGTDEQDIDIDAEISVRIARGERATDIARELSRRGNVPRSDVYARVLSMQQSGGANESDR